MGMLLRRYRQEVSKKEEEETTVETAPKSIYEMTVPELKKEAKEREITGYSTMNKDELINALKAGDSNEEG